MIRRKFANYLTFREDNTVLLSHVLNRIFQEKVDNTIPWPLP